MKKENILLKNSEHYAGQYVATRTFKRKEVVSSGADPVAVYDEAKNKGVHDPVVFYIPEKNMIQIYNAY